MLNTLLFLPQQQKFQAKTYRDGAWWMLSFIKAPLFFEWKKKSQFFSPELNAREAHIFLMDHHHFVLPKVPNKIFNYSYFSAFDGSLSHFHYHLIRLGACCLQEMNLGGRNDIGYSWHKNKILLMTIFGPSRGEREREEKKVINESY